MSKLAEIKELLAAITPEPWVAVARHSGNDGTQDEMDGLGWDIEGPPKPMRGQFSRCADAQLAAHSPEYVALLVTVVEAARVDDGRRDRGAKRVARVRGVSMSAKRMKLDQFPCPIGVGFICNAKCAEAIDNCGAVMCRFLDVYRKAEADHRCARLLRVINGRFLFRLAQVFRYGTCWDSAYTYLAELRQSIHKYLRAAGLE